MQKLLKQIERYPVIPVFYADDLAKCIAVLKASYAGGIRVFEFVHRGSNALVNFKALLAYKKEHLPDLSLGIGTIKTVELAQQYIDLGAEFIVSPIIVPAIAQVTLAKGILWIPGCMTPTEIALAESLDAPLVKLFPGDSLGVGFLKAIKPLFPNTLFMPTGGVTIEESNVREWRDAGVFAIGLGSKLFQEPLDSPDPDWLAKRCQQLISWT